MLATTDEPSILVHGVRLTFLADLPANVIRPKPPTKELFMNQ